ncbi:hypothetical protein MA16_Dca013567 [Dendrobium catenatum]|uniref:Uncharacterized protein n=1 Tax=Dendrobium catenatum TaxID=906689 RepID=A0A2I0VPT8_9ASPA|nr:hypothetical protein MA16_Dca013567 [Dendrobium catenatum]
MWSLLHLVFQIYIWGGDFQLRLGGKRGIFYGGNGGDQSEFGLVMEAWETHLKVGTLVLDSQYKKLQGGGNEQGVELVGGEGEVYKKFGKEQFPNKGIPVQHLVVFDRIQVALAQEFLSQINGYDSLDLFCDYSLQLYRHYRLRETGNAL